MINKLRLQTQSVNKSIHDFGCLYSCYLAMIQDKAHEILDDARIIQIFERAKNTKAIYDNEIPIGSPGWYRAFCAWPQQILNLAASELKIQIMPPVTSGKFDAITPDTIKIVCNYKYIIAKLRYKKTLEHFVVGHFEENDFFIDYDPAGRTAKDYGALLSIRGWNI